MTIPEAVRLVLQAGAMGEGGEIFVLDMGEPVRIVDLAREMIRLSGLEPDRDIEIVFTGVRPGEKLDEKLFNEGEEVVPTDHAKIAMAVRRPLPRSFLKQELDQDPQRAALGRHRRRRAHRARRRPGRGASASRRPARPTAAAAVAAEVSAEATAAGGAASAGLIDVGRDRRRERQRRHGYRRRDGAQRSRRTVSARDAAAPGQST